MTNPHGIVTSKKIYENIMGNRGSKSQFLCKRATSGRFLVCQYT